MTAAPIEAYQPPHGGWTTDDLDDLPLDGYRRELLDGVLLVSPSPTDIHQIIAGRLMVTLEETCPPQYQVTQGVEIRLSNRRSFIPDVLVTTDEAGARGGAKYAPHEVVLAVEIVSAGSASMDRILKPQLYATAGIPYFWRIETHSGLTVHTHTLNATTQQYAETGQWTTMIDLGEPWAIKLPIGRLAPRHLPPSAE
ncbi:MAG TPA: Uma2 family endonuclease [Pilimelia sp.]|nr:Uma2 family endonuclease [Pilimelia sp.]